MGGIRRAAAALALALAGLTAVAFGQPTLPDGEAETAAPARPAWGTTDRILCHVPVTDFLPVTTVIGFKISSNMGLYSDGAPSSFQAIPHVPSGALLTYLELDYCDTAAFADVGLFLSECSYLGSGCTLTKSLTSGDGLLECGIVTVDLTDLNYTMDNNARELVLTAYTAAGDASTQLRGAYIGYRLQISPAPASPTFGDVPTTHLYFRAIEALAASGVTGGCGNGNFCPNQNLTRGEMAAFLARALGLHFPN
jgi:hypothetical protein